MTILEIRDFPDYYVSNEGDIYSRKYHPIRNKNNNLIKIKPQIRKDGYSIIHLRKEEKTFAMYVHRLVAEMFIPNPENKMCINHIDGNRHNNSVSNLEWCSYSENSLHSYRQLGRKAPWKEKKGKDFPLSKIVLQIKDGTVVAEFYGIRDAARKTGFSSSSISQCCQGSTKYSHVHGFQWKYK